MQTTIKDAVGLKDDVMRFAFPLSLMHKIEANIPGSFPERPTWQDLVTMK